MTRIGIVNISYECAATLDKVFQPWANLKGEDFEIYISSQHICFPETHILGHPLKSQDGTIEILNRLHSEEIINYLEINNFPVFEQIGWSKNIPPLVAHNLDYLVMVGSDEIWTEQQIKDTFKFIRENPADYYKVNFKNYINHDEYVDDFIVPRIWSMTRRGGVKRFWKDDLVVFNDDVFDYQTDCVNIPKHIAFVNHYSWALPPKEDESEESYSARNKSFITRKLGFSNLRYQLCSYKLNESNNRLIFNDDYYTQRNLTKPIIYKESKLNELFKAIYDSGFYE